MIKVSKFFDPEKLDLGFVYINTSIQNTYILTEKSDLRIIN